MQLWEQWCHPAPQDLGNFPRWVLPRGKAQNLEMPNAAVLTHSVLDNTGFTVHLCEPWNHETHVDIAETLIIRNVNLWRTCGAPASVYTAGSGPMQQDGQAREWAGPRVKLKQLLFKRRDSGGSQGNASIPVSWEQLISLNVGRCTSRTKDQRVGIDFQKCIKANKTYYNADKDPGRHLVYCFNVLLDGALN